MRVRFLLAAFLIFSFNPADAQSAEDSVKNVIQLFFKGMKLADTSIIREAIAPTALLQTIETNRQGRSSVKDESINEFLKVVSALKPGTADEKIEFAHIQIDGPLASVWTPYQFFYEGKFSHCGINSFQLVRLGVNWRIQYIIDTRRKINCNSSR